MTALDLAAGLAVATAFAHSFLSERLFLRPLRREATAAGVLSAPSAKRLATAMFHLASLSWVGMAASMLMLGSEGGDYRPTLVIYAGFFALSGLGNFWAVGRPHPGGVLLLLASASILASLYA